MKTFPMFIKVDDGRIVIIGGGETAAQKTRLALKTEAEIVVVASTLSQELASLAAKGRIAHFRPDDDGLFDDARLVSSPTVALGLTPHGRASPRLRAQGL